jgi:ADP-heptose:LPS heptosyltransferase
MVLKKTKINIVISWRIGDAVCTIPMLLCLKQLNEKYNTNFEFTILMQSYLEKLFSPLGIFHCEAINLQSKLKSYFLPSDKMFFLETTSKNFGYHTKLSCGLSNFSKKHLRFEKELPFLNFESPENGLPEELFNFLRNDCKLGCYSTSLFGVCLELGYTIEQIKETFTLSPLNLEKFSAFSFKKDKYVVFCMEAANNRKGDAYRCWDEENYFEIARKCHKELSLKSLFIGTNTAVKIPSEKYFIDLRKKLNLYELATVLKDAEYYIGNDTGPLHIANLMQTPSIGVYFREKSTTDFTPIFRDLNTAVLNPQNADEVYQLFMP